MKDLKVLYEQVKDLMMAVKVDEIWSGFVPGKFALYEEGR